MRRWLIVLVIALLPLRGGVGLAMAGEMAAQQLKAMISIAINSHSERAATGFFYESLDTAMADCPGHAGTPQQAVTPEGCASCVHCQACNTVALQPDAPTLPFSVAPPVVHAAGAVRFASASAFPALKPPIS